MQEENEEQKQFVDYNDQVINIINRAIERS